MTTAEIFSTKRNITAPSFTTNLKINAPQQMDGLELLQQLPDNSIPLVFFDPQYRSALDKMRYGKINRQKKRHALPQMDNECICRFVKEIERVLVSTGHLMLWVDKYILCNNIRTFTEGTSLQLVDFITWHKGKMGMGYRSRRCAEYLLIFQKPPVKVQGVWKLHNIPDVWTEKVDTKKHVHAKPIELQRKLIEAVTNIRDIVVDPAAGSYSVLKVSKETARRFIGADIKFSSHD